MEKIIKANGYVYLVEGDLRAETRYNLGKDLDDPMWAEEAKEIKRKYQKRSYKNKKENE